MSKVNEAVAFSHKMFDLKESVLKMRSEAAKRYGYESREVSSLEKVLEVVENECSDAFKRAEELCDQ